MYRQFMSRADYARIVNEDFDAFPHCNTTTFHSPNVCAYCDSYYRQHPEFRPAEYADSAANGWGGNMAPIVDDERAAEEQAAWEEACQDMLDGTWQKKEKKRIMDRVEEIVSRFRKDR